MISLARATLRHEWRRFLPAVLAVAFSGLLVLVQTALLLGMFVSVSLLIDRSSADLWVGFPDTASVDLARNIPERLAAHLWMHPEVARVETFRWAGGDWRRPDGAAVSGYLLGIDTRPQAMTLQQLIPPPLRARLDEPDGVIIDVADLDKLGVGVGDVAELNHKRVKVVAAVDGMRAVGGVNLVSSLATARRVDAAAHEGEMVDYFVVGLRDPRRAEAVRDALQPRGEFRPFTVWTAEEFSRRSQLYWLEESGAGASSAFASLLGILVGVIITSQTLRAAVLAALREYATLRALGVPLAALRRVVLEQSLWVALAGLGLTFAITALFALGARALHVPLSLPGWLLAGTAALQLGVTCLSGVVALRALAATEPATLLR